MIGRLRLDGAAYMRAIPSIVACNGGYWVGLGQNIPLRVQNVLSELRYCLSESDVEMVEEPSNEIRKETSISSTVEKISIENGESSQAEAAVKKGNKLLNWHGESLFPLSTTGKVKSSVWLHGGFSKDKSGKLKMENSI